MNKRIYIGQTFVASLLEPAVDTGVLVLCYPGSGEATGLKDGSRLSSINYGFDEGKDYSFTIMKVQTLTSNYYTAWAEIMKYVDDHSSNCVVIGWSLGAREVMDLLLGFQGRVPSTKIKLMVAIDGPASGTPDYSKASIPLLIVTGRGGKYYYPLVNQRNELVKNEKGVLFNEMGPTLDHSALMRSVYSDTTSGNYKFLMDRFLSMGGEPIPSNKIVDSSVKNNIITFVDEKGNKYTVNVTPG